MYAIIEAGGKQYKVQEGDILFLEKMDAGAGDSVKFEKILAFSDGEKLTVGTPFVSGISVDATVIKNGKSGKINIFKYKPKKGYRRRQGHRQPYTKVQIGRIYA
jgi:large subunit ribosomal protein L21